MYRALYRKYRSKNFDELLGQEHVVRTLRQQVESGDVSHAYVFSGTRGTGKTSAAKIMSRAINCEHPVNGNPCNECASCRGIIDESIFDVVEMDAASNNSVEDIRDLRDKAVYPPSHLKYKVYIIDEVHMLSKGAFNALLKLLEEPPRHLVFILATTEPERIPPTIISRCQRFDFKRITTADMLKQMRMIVTDEKINIDDGALMLVARNADGAMRDALSLLDQLVTSGLDNIDEQCAADLLGLANEDVFFDITNAIFSGDVKAALFKLDEVLSRGKDSVIFSKDLIRHIRNLLIAKEVEKPADLLSGYDVQRYADFVKDIDTGTLILMLDHITKMEEGIRFSVQPRIHLEMAIIDVIRKINTGGAFESFVVAKSEITKRSEQVSRRVEEKPERMEIVPVVEKKKAEKEVVNSGLAVERAAVPENTVAQQEVYNGALSDIQARWQEVMAKIKSVKVPLAAILIEATLASYDNDVLVLGFKEGYEFHLNTASMPANKALIDGALTAVFGRKINHICELIVPAKDEKLKKLQDFFGKENVTIE